jgi:uncharacterized protein with ParB-like and HNH nuclease domain/predicted transport protein
MKAVESNLFKFLQGTKQFVIPIYQRTYSWSKPQCEQLWNDIIKAGSDENIPGHFIGSVVYIEKGIYQVSSVNQLLVIDGQQRLTTLSLLLLALAKYFEEKERTPDKTKKKLLNYYLLNSEEEDLQKYKLYLTQTDKETYFSFLEEKDLPKEFSPRVVENYKYFEESIKKSNLEPEEILNGIHKLFIVDVSLDRNYDNPQLIFESLNSTGLDLSQADLIRNYILMGQEPKLQEELYKKYWFPMEQSYGYEYNSYFDRFMRDFLTIKTGTIPVMRDVYRDFKKYLTVKTNINMTDVVKDIKYYSDLYVSMAFARFDDKEINDAFKDIIELKVEVAYPFLIQVFSDYSQKVIDKKSFLEILRSVESYVFRRVVVGIPTNSLNKTFANLYKEIIKEDYLVSYHAIMNLKDSYRRFPTDEEFKKEFVIKDFYNFRSRNYLLRKLENFGRKELVQVEEYTIEHILPQNKNLSKEWKEMLGEDWENIQKKYLHTIGNLTLTGYNPELSDKPFLEKRNMSGGFKDSPIRLNGDLAILEKWNEEEIQKRANNLADKVTTIFAYKDISEEILEKYQAKEKESENGQYTVENFSRSLQGEMLVLFNHLRIRILNIDSSVREEYKKLYIAYKNTTNFVDIEPQKKRLRLNLNMDFDEIKDPESKCKDVTDLGTWGNGNVEFSVFENKDIDYAMFLIEQSYHKHAELNGD